MNRVDYLILRNKGEFSLNFIFDYYLDKCQKDCIKDINQFLQLIQIWLMKTGQNINELLEHLVKQYDNKFTIVSILDKEGKTIKYI